MNIDEKYQSRVLPWGGGGTRIRLTVPRFNGEGHLLVCDLLGIRAAHVDRAPPIPGLALRVGVAEIAPNIVAAAAAVSKMPANLKYPYGVVGAGADNSLPAYFLREPHGVGCRAEVLRDSAGDSRRAVQYRSRYARCTRCFASKE